ncbi:MAG: tryptophan synthase subunit alpha [Candidatus Helarchaeota archaeon]
MININRIDKTFQILREDKEGALIAYIAAGDPDFETSIAIGEEIANSGADILELGIPFSDPIADGPTIQAATQRALQAGMSPKKAMEIASVLSKKIPIAFMTYYNIPLQYGLETFIQDCKKSGVSGIIIPDLPIEEADPLLIECLKEDLDQIFFAAPTTPTSRIKKTLPKARGFLYVVALLGVTGARSSLSTLAKSTLSTIKQITRDQIPLSIGFGLSKPQHLRQVFSYGADGAIIGSAIVNKIAQLNKISITEIGKYIKNLKPHTKK